MLHGCGSALYCGSTSFFSLLCGSRSGYCSCFSFKVMRIWDYCSTDPPRLRPDPTWLHFEPRKLPSLDFHVNPDPGPSFRSFRSIADPDPASQNNMDPCKSGSTVLLVRICHKKSVGLRSWVGLPVACFYPTYFCFLLSGICCTAAQERRTNHGKSSRGTDLLCP